MFRNLQPLLVLLFLLLAGCSNGNPGPKPPPPEGAAQPYVVKGRVTDSHGSPLAGIEVFADNTAYYNMNIYGVTDVNGNYRIDLGDIIPSSWRVGAYLKRAFQGETFEYSLHPENDAVFAGSTGAIRNLTWRLTGETPEGGNYGGLVHVLDEGFSLDMDHVELTIVPVGPLIDGSAGETISGPLERGVEFVDVPVGNYRATARYLPPDAPAADLLIRVRDTGIYATSVTAPLRLSDFLGPLLSLEVKLP